MNAALEREYAAAGQLLAELRITLSSTGQVAIEKKGDLDALSTLIKRLFELTR